MIMVVICQSIGEIWLSFVFSFWSPNFYIHTFQVLQQYIFYLECTKFVHKTIAQFYLKPESYLLGKYIRILIRHCIFHKVILICSYENSLLKQNINMPSKQGTIITNLPCIYQCQHCPSSVHCMSTSINIILYNLGQENTSKLWTI